jgi:hypothetical protein
VPSTHTSDRAAACGDFPPPCSRRTRGGEREMPLGPPMASCSPFGGGGRLFPATPEICPRMSTPSCYEYQKMGLIKNGTTCVTKTTTHTSKKLRKWPNRDRTTPSSMALFGHYLAKNHPTKNAIEQKYSPRARASSGHAPWRCPTDFPFHGFPPALLTIFYIMNRQQGSRSG